MHRVAFAGENHVGLDDAGVKIDTKIAQGLDEIVENLAGNFGRAGDGVVAVIDDFRFDDRDKAGRLTGGGIFGEFATVGVNSGF